jgi:hypothetical protein
MFLILLFDIEIRNNKMPEVEREILPGFWKAHILHHAGEEPVHGQWNISEIAKPGGQL